MSGHWTSRSVKDFVHRIASDFSSQIEKKMDEFPITRSGLAERIGVSNGRVSQVLGNPGNMTIGKMVEYAKSVGMKVAIVAYDDGDPENNNGPVNSQIFSLCWKKVGKPTDFFTFKENSDAMSVRTQVIIRYIPKFPSFQQTGVTRNRVKDTIDWIEQHSTSSGNDVRYGVQ